MTRSRLLIAAAAVLALSLSCSRGPKVIPGRKLSRIYEEMFMSDKWMNLMSDHKGFSDTVLVYDPIFRKYGYTYEDYCFTVSKFMDKPDKFEKLVDRLHADLEKRKKAILAANEQARAEEREREANRAPETGFPRYYGLNYEGARTDTVVFMRDTVRGYDVMVPQEWPPVRTFDTLAIRVGGITEMFVEKFVNFQYAKAIDDLKEAKRLELDKERLKDLDLPAIDSGEVPYK